MFQLAIINGIECIVSECNYPPCGEAEAKGYAHHYYIRHADAESDRPATIEANPVLVNLWGHAFFKEAKHSLDTTQFEEIQTFKKAANCPKCGELYCSDGEGHDYDAIFEYGLCTDCLGKCPYCTDCASCNEETNNGDIIECPECGEKFCPECYDDAKQGCEAHAPYTSWAAETAQPPFN